MVGFYAGVGLAAADTASDRLEISVGEKRWSCSCGFATHNEYVWIEHIHICRQSYGHQKEEPVDVRRTVSQPVGDSHAAVRDVPFGITAESTSEKIDKHEKTTIFRPDDQFDAEWRERRKRVVIAIATAFAIPVIIMTIMYLSPQHPVHRPVIVAPDNQYGDFAKGMFANKSFDPIKAETARKPNQISPFDFRFAAKSDWIIMPVQTNKTAKKVVEPVKDNDVLTGEDQESDEDQDLDEDQDADEERDPSPGNDTQEKTLENK